MLCWTGFPWGFLDGVWKGGWDTQPWVLSVNLLGLCVLQVNSMAQESDGIPVLRGVLRWAGRPRRGWGKKGR